jgi:hypothetical protein
LTLPTKNPPKKRARGYQPTNNNSRSPRGQGNGPSSIPKERNGAAAVGKQNPDGILTERQQRFVNAVARDGMNIAAASRIAGYERSTINQGERNNLMKNPKILKAIAVEREKWAAASQMTKKKVIDGLLEAIDMAKLQADPTPMIQGWTQIGKLCGFYEPTRHKLEVSVKGEVVIQKLQQLDDEQLLALADGRTDILDGEFTVLE